MNFNLPTVQLSLSAIPEHVRQPLRCTFHLHTFSTATETWPLLSNKPEFATSSMTLQSVTTMGNSFILLIAFCGALSVSTSLLSIPESKRSSLTPSQRYQISYYLKYYVRNLALLLSQIQPKTQLTSRPCAFKTGVSLRSW